MNKVIGIVINTSSKALSSIDESFDVIIKHYGRPFELFKHYQDTHDDDYINIIVSGMKLPVDDIKAVYDKYKKHMSQVDVAKDSFFSRKFDTEDGDAFDFGVPSEIEKEEVIKKKTDDFFSKYNLKSSEEPVASPFQEGHSKFINTMTNEI